jgi:hypothetical protein
MCIRWFFNIVEQNARCDNKNTLYDHRTTTKSPNDAFLRTYPRH